MNTWERRREGMETQRDEKTRHDIWELDKTIITFNTWDRRDKENMSNETDEKRKRWDLSLGHMGDKKREVKETRRDKKRRHGKTKTSIT